MVHDRGHPEGVPYDVASRYTKEDAKVLLGMLKDPAEKPWWTNIATTICFIGDDSAVKEKMNYVPYRIIAKEDGDKDGLKRIGVDVFRPELEKLIGKKK